MPRYQATFEFTTTEDLLDVQLICSEALINLQRISEDVDAELVDLETQVDQPIE